jgi:hypothetical protein
MPALQASITNQPCLNGSLIAAQQWLRRAMNHDVATFCNGVEAAVSVIDSAYKQIENMTEPKFKTSPHRCYGQRTLSYRENHEKKTRKLSVTDRGCAPAENFSAHLSASAPSVLRGLVFLVVRPSICVLAESVLKVLSRVSENRICKAPSLGTICAQYSCDL